MPIDPSHRDWRRRRAHGLLANHKYRGGYSESNGVITFQWEGWSIAGAWGATGTLKDGSLTVQYNIIMMLSDFEDAVYGGEG